MSYQIFLYLMSENQILINKNFNELKTIKKQVINIEKVLQNFRSNFDKFSVKIDTYKFFNFAKKNILFQNISRKIELIDLEDEQSLADYIQLNYYNNNLEEDVQKIYDSFVEENLDFKFITDAYKFLFYNSLLENF